MNFKLEEFWLKVLDEKLITLLLFVADTTFGLLEEMIGVIAWHLIFVVWPSFVGAMVMNFVVVVIGVDVEPSLFNIRDDGVAPGL